MRIVFASQAWDDYTYWQSADPRTAKRIDDLIEDALRTPFQGVGKPEPLRGDLSGWRSRRITREHRLVYRMSGKGESQALEIASCRFHYGA